MEKGTNDAVFPEAELVVNRVEYDFWTESGRVETLPEGRRAAGRRIADVFPTWKNWRLVESGTEVAPGIQMLDAYGHTPGHSVFLVTSGRDQLMVSNDTMYVPPFWLLIRNGRAATIRTDRWRSRPAGRSPTAPLRTG